MLQNQVPYQWHVQILRTTAACLHRGRLPTWFCWQSCRGCRCSTSVARTEIQQYVANLAHRWSRPRWNRRYGTHTRPARNEWSIAEPRMLFYMRAPPFKMSLDQDGAGSNPMGGYVWNTAKNPPPDTCWSQTIWIEKGFETISIGWKLCQKLIDSSQLAFLLIG